MLEHSIFIDFLILTAAVAVTVCIVNMRIRSEDDKLLRAKTVFFAIHDRQHAESDFL